ncbi:MAG: hypothetical protein IBGAMO2_240003 [Arenicellales bacterium IbO2]|nr:hypothetical protein [Alphaproteobacteria bacterium]CAJ2376224.1 MAG: hypothetical protein IBGAMO2_240003 [Arenicellales bacterium IbO2]
MSAFALVWYSDFSFNFYGDIKMLFWSIAKLVGWIISAGIACVGLYFAWVRLCLIATANQAKLKATGMLVSRGEIKIQIKNTGSKKVIINHIEICRVKIRGIGLCDCNREYQSCKVVLSGTEDDDYTPTELTLYDPLAFPDESHALDVGKSCARFFPFEENEDLAELAKTKREAKTVQFVVCTDYGKFPVKSEKRVKKLVVSSIISAIKRRKNRVAESVKER